MYPYLLKELIEIDCATPVFVKQSEQICSTLFGKDDSVGLHAFHELLKVQWFCAIIIHDAKCPTKHKNNGNRVKGQLLLDLLIVSHWNKYL